MTTIGATGVNTGYSNVQQKKSKAVRNGAIAGTVAAVGSQAATLIKYNNDAKKIGKTLVDVLPTTSKGKYAAISAAWLAMSVAMGAGIGAIVKACSKKAEKD